MDDQRFGPFEIPALPRDGKGKKSALCPVRAIKRYLKVTEGKRKLCNRLFLNPKKGDKAVAKNTISFWLRQVMVKACDMESDKGAKAHSVRSLSTSLQFSVNRSLPQVLKAGTWTSQNTFTNRYLRDYSVKYLDKFCLEIGPVIAAQALVHKQPQKGHADRR